LRLTALFKSTVFYSIIGFLPVASQALLAPVFSNYLTRYEYGIINLMNIFGAYLTVAIGLGFDGAFSVYYFHYYKKRKWLSRLTSSVFITILFLAVVVFFLMIILRPYLFSFFGGDVQFDFTRFDLPVFFICLTAVLFSIMQYYFRNEDNYRLYAVFSIGFFILISLGQYLGLKLISADAWGIIYGRMIASILMGIIILVYVFRTNYLFFSARLFKKCLLYAYPMAIYGLLWVAFENIDKMGIEKKFGKEVLGVYGISILFSSFLELIRTSFVSSISPIVYRNINSNEMTAKESVRTSMRFFVVALCNATALLMMCTYPLLHFFINSKFHAAIVFIPVLFLSVIPRLYFSYFAMPLFYFGKTKALAIINLLSLLGSWAYLYFIGNSLGPLGICFVVVLAKVIQCLGVWVYTIYSSKLKVKYGFDYIGKDNLIVGVTAVCLVVTIFLTSEQPSYTYLFNLLPLLTVAVTLGMYGKKIWRKAFYVLRTIRFKLPGN
jgi:O-antigen/teichoic acid export membrane protein